MSNNSGFDLLLSTLEIAFAVLDTAVQIKRTGSVLAMFVLATVRTNLGCPSFNVLTSVRKLGGTRNRKGEKRKKSETFHEELHYADLCCSLLVCSERC